MSGREVRDDEIFSSSPRIKKRPRSSSSITSGNVNNRSHGKFAACVEHRESINVRSVEKTDKTTACDWERHQSSSASQLPAQQKAALTRNSTGRSKGNLRESKTIHAPSLNPVLQHDYQFPPESILTESSTGRVSRSENKQTLSERETNCPDRARAMLDCCADRFSSSDAYNLKAHHPLSGYTAPRKRADVLSQFDPLPWRIGRTAPDDVSLNGVPRLSEICLHGVRRQAAAGNLGDMDCFPDDIAVQILRSVSESVLVDLERKNPTRQLVLDACWADLCSEDELPDDIPRWRALVERKREDLQRQLDNASRRLRERYSEQVASRQQRAVSHTRLVAGTAERRRRPSNRGGGAIQASSVIGRLRDRLKRERLLDNRQRRNLRLSRDRHTDR